MRLYIVRTITGKKEIIEAESMSEALRRSHGIPESADLIPQYLETVFKPYALATV